MASDRRNFIKRETACGAPHLIFLPRTTRLLYECSMGGAFCRRKLERLPVALNSLTSIRAGNWKTHATGCYGLFGKRGENSGCYCGYVSQKESGCIHETYNMGDVDFSAPPSRCPAIPKFRLSASQLVWPVWPRR
jgi:hypothetical protein